jgi:hypothetical protein
MKLKLNLEFSYLAGLIKHSKIKKAIGVCGPQKVIEAFLKHVIENKIFEEKKIIITEKCAYSYHTKYRKFLNQIIKEQVDRFKHHNEYAACFLAGLYDFSGIEKPDFILIKKWDKKDKMVLENLRFYVQQKEEGLIIYNKEVFLKFIKNYSKRVEE